jgi:hypothetical protein
MHFVFTYSILRHILHERKKNFKNLTEVHRKTNSITIHEKQKYNPVKTVPKPNRKMVETEEWMIPLTYIYTTVRRRMDTPNIHIHNCQKKNGYP